MQVKVRAVIINNEGKILLQKLAKSGFWCLPGGTFEDGEVLEACLEREIIEELGIVPKIGQLAHIQSFIRSEDVPGKAKKGDSVIDTWYFIENPEDFTSIDLAAASHGFESEQVEWFASDDFPEPFAPKYLPELLTEWNAHGKRFLSIKENE